jgi:hypothetical protein
MSQDVEVQVLFGAQNGISKKSPAALFCVLCEPEYMALP